jgi:GWxTD domain-containing protein
MIRSCLSLAAIVCLAASAAFAGGLSNQYRDWPLTPQGYFMTTAERAEWKASVKSDAEAEQFIKKFLDRRGPGFAEDVAERAQMADKHLTVGNAAGSRTLRGKVVILLGPPSDFTKSTRSLEGERTSAIGQAAVSSVNIDGGNMGNVSDANSRQALATRSVMDYVFTYRPDKLPVKQTKDLVIIVEVNPSDGSDKFHDPLPQLAEIFEAAAQARLAAAKPKQ